jgi:hypothetical protein
VAARSKHSLTVIFSRTGTKLALCQSPAACRRYGRVLPGFVVRGRPAPKLARAQLSRHSTPSGQRRPMRTAIRSATRRTARLRFLRLKRSPQCTSRGCVQLQNSRVVSSRPGLARNARRMPRTTKRGGVMAESRRHSPVSAADCEIPTSWDRTQKHIALARISREVMGRFYNLFVVGEAGRGAN